MVYGANCFCVYDWKDPVTYHKGQFLPMGGMMAFPVPPSSKCEEGAWGPWLKNHEILRTTYGYAYFRCSFRPDARVRIVEEGEAFDPVWEELAMEWDVIAFCAIHDLSPLPVVTRTCVVLSKDVVVW